MRGRHAQPSALRTSLTYLPGRSFTCPSCTSRIATRTSPSNSLDLRCHASNRRSQSTWAAAIDAAQHVFASGKHMAATSLPGGVKIDPFKSVAKELKFLTTNIRQLVGSGHPVLDTVAKYYTQSEGKHIRPMLVLLISQATAQMQKTGPSHPLDSPAGVDTPISPPEVLADVKPILPASLTSQDDYRSTTADHSDILPSQRRLAEITELIHTASLLHDDVLDHSTTRRSAPSANIQFGNKMAVLAGDFLLGRASVALARLRSPEVTELLATVIANLIEGEFLQLRNTMHDEKKPRYHPTETMNYYLQKTYLKSASLISKSCRAAAILGQVGPDAVDAAYLYGRNLGLAFQLVDDMLDFTITGEELGKPAGADLELGLATAPLLFAWKDCDELGELVGRKFVGEGDVARARQLVRESDGIEQTRVLAQEYADKAAEAIARFPESEAKRGLTEMCVKVMQRRK